MARKTFRKIITTEENTENINPKNKKMIERFLKEKNTRLSDLTIKNYASDLNIFFTWNLLNNENKFFIDIKKIELSDFFNFTITELKWSPARFVRMKSCLSSLSDFIERFFDEDYPTFRNVINKAIESMPKTAVREKTILEESQVNSLLHHLTEKGKYQEACWLSLAISSGSRFSELLRFTTDAIDENNIAFDGIFLETTKKIKTKGRGKLGKSINKYIIKDLFLPYYNKWLEKRTIIMEENNKNHTAIFVKNNGDPLTEYSVRTWISYFEEFLNIDFYPHSVRHYTTTFLTKIGLPAQLIVEIFGWESSAMYDIYNDLEAKDMEWKELKGLKTHIEEKY